MNIESSLNEGMKKFNRLSKQTFRNPNPDHVHDLRVITRRLRADLWLIPKAERTPFIQKARRDLRHLGQVLGEQRKYDVALEDAIRYKRKTKKIRKKLKTARSEVLEAFRKKKRKRYVDHLKRAVEDSKQVLVTSFCPRIEHLIHHLERAMLNTPKSTIARHHLRINVKKARYLLEALNNEIPELARLQDKLGRWHDLVVLSGLSGHPKEIVTAHRNQWHLVELHLKPALKRTIEALSKLEVRLRSAT